MISLMTPTKAQKQLAENVRLKRLERLLTQEGLATRSGVALSTLRKFEQNGVISLEGFLKLQLVLGGLDKIIKATQPIQKPFSSIDEVLGAENQHTRKRGRRK